MNNFLLTIAVLLFSSSCSAVSDVYDGLFRVKATKYNVDPVILKSIAYHESRLQPYATNINGEGFTFPSLQKALSGLRYVAKRPWMLKVRVRVDGKLQTARRFYSTKLSMNGALSRYKANRQSKNQTKLPVLDSMKTNGHKEYIMARKLNINSTDLGLAQINYKYHDTKDTDVVDWYTPARNIDYQARLYSQLLKKHNDPMIAVAHYHSGTKELQEIYMSDFKEHYKTVSASWKPTNNSGE